MFDNFFEFKQYFTPFLKDFDIKPVLTSVNNPQDNAPVQRVHQVILNMLVTRYLDNKVFNYIYPWGETLSHIACVIRAYYHRTVMDTPGQAVFGIDILFNLASIIYWQVLNATKQRQVYIDNVRENAKRVVHDYAIGDQVYVEMTDIYHKLDYSKQVPYIITEVFRNVTVRVQRGHVDEIINIRQLKPHFDE